MNSIHKRTHRIGRTLALGALLAAAAVAPTVADAAQPKAGVYAGKTTQSGIVEHKGSIRLGVAKLDGAYKVQKATARVKLDCQGDPARIKTISVAIPAGSGKVSSSGRFSYSASVTATTGVTIKGRFLTRTKVSGTLFYGETSGCYVPGGAKWGASLR